MTIRAPTKSAGGLMKFTVKKQTCLGCKAVLGPGEEACCKHCLADAPTIYMRQVS